MELFRRNEPVLVNRDHYQRPAPIPDLRLRDLTPDLSSMSKRDDGTGKGASSTTPIVIGVVVPAIIIVIILLVIWRRRQKITKQEEMTEHMKYKSLDFGVDETQIREKKGRKKPDLTIQDIKGSLRKDRGLSMDLDASNPYLLPPEVHSSRESLHSLSRSINTGDDKYRATTFVPDDGSLRSPSSLRSHGDNASVFTASTRHRTGTMETDSRTDFLPRVPPKRDDSEAASVRKPLPVVEKPEGLGLMPPNAQFDRNSTLSTVSKDGNVAALRASNNYLGQYISGGQSESAPKKNDQPGLMVHEMEVQPTPPADNVQQPPIAVIHHEVTTSRRSSIYNHGIAELADNHSSRRSSYQDPKLPQIHTTSYEMDASPQQSQQQIPQRKKSLRNSENFSRPGRRQSSNQLASVPEVQKPQQENQHHDDAASDYYDEEGFDDYANYVDYTYRGSMMGVRPLPPDDPTENPEQRANRIRSFYKEYFEEGSKPQNSRTSYYDGSEQYDDFDYGYYEQSHPYSVTHSRGPSIRSDQPGRHRAYSHGTRPQYPPGPRAYSSMSGRMGPRARAQSAPKKKLPPPKPLMVLPTPHMLKDDNFLPNAIDFAPPQVFRNQRSGTPDSLRGGLRPYSPSVKPHNPLASSFDDLAVIPSPHSLRKSGTFTGLDFAPPRRFKDSEAGSMAGSETGSIHSSRSNLSKVQLASIRNGAYRVSRIPKDVAGTKDDMFTALKPKWDMRGDGMGVGR